MNTKSWFQNMVDDYLKPPKPLAPGSYAFQSPVDAPVPFRMHLRIEPDGNGVLIVNAATVLHLNQTAVEYANLYMNGFGPEQGARRISRRYKVSAAAAEGDYTQFIHQIEAITQTPDLDPEMTIGSARQTPYTGVISAPYRLDCALTYRMRSGEYASGVPQLVAEMEMTPEQWMAAVDLAWKAGIPHLVFTGGEATLRPDLADLLAHAEKNGQVTGLITDGLAMNDEAYLQKLIESGLDHLMMILQPEKEESWHALGKILPADLFTAVHLTITPENRTDIANIIKRLAEMGANGISLSAAEADLAPDLSAARETAAQYHLNLVWDLPVPFAESNPIAAELSPDEIPSGAGRAWLYVEPDGDVFATQGATHSFGNILRDPWTVIWQSTQS